MSVFVLDKQKKPLMPCSEKRARQLLERKRAVVHKIEPFTIRLKDRKLSESKVEPLRLKLDPGSKTTGIAVLDGGTAIWLGELKHKVGIKKRLDSRRAIRNSRRNRKTRYRKPRFLNRKREKGWLPPSLESRVDQTLNVVIKLRNLLPITTISTEHVKFDTQLIANPDINGIEYQQGELIGYEVKEYLLEKWNRKCAYCRAENIPLEIDHYIPRSKGGTNRVSNLTLACKTCNQIKGSQMPEEWAKKLTEEKALNVLKIKEQLKKPLRDAAMLNATRWRLYEELKATGLEVECGTGARTKMQRLQKGLAKTHYFDACCVGKSTPKELNINPKYVHLWSALGRGNRQMCRPDKHGFPRGHRQRTKFHFGFQTGDIVTADIPKGKYMGKYRGRILCRASGYFDIKNSIGKKLCQGINYKHFRIIQQNDGWMYGRKKIA